MTHSPSLAKNLWSKDDTAVDERMQRFCAYDDVALDVGLLPYDVRATKAHVRGLSRIALLSAQETADLLLLLDELAGLVDSGSFVIGDEFEDATVMNWPQNDYFEETTLDVSDQELHRRYADSKSLSLSLLYWLQTEAPRPDGGVGYPGCRLRPDLTGTDDGFAMHPYIREARRIEAQFTILEQHVSAHDNPGKNVADPFWDSVGIGAYRIDLHPSTNGRNTVDFSSLPFQIPLGSLIPVRMRNVLPACKNLGVTHITNGCYRLHPVEWNIGEAVGALVRWCLSSGLGPAQVYENRSRVKEYQGRLLDMGVELEWPQLHPL